MLKIRHSHMKNISAGSPCCLQLIPPHSFPIRKDGPAVRPASPCCCFVFSSSKYQARGEHPLCHLTPPRREPHYSRVWAEASSDSAAASWTGPRCGLPLLPWVSRTEFPFSSDPFLISFPEPFSASRSLRESPGFFDLSLCRSLLG